MCLTKLRALPPARLALALVLLVLACSADKPTTEPGDTTPPAAVANLSAGAATSSSLLLTWSAPGDDGSTGTAARYDIRYAVEPITEAGWEEYTQVDDAPAPVAAGGSQAVTVSGLAPFATYYFALKTADEIPNWSGLSNVAEGTTLPGAADTTAPAAITDLATGAATTNSIVLGWTATGDDSTDGTAARYDLRYANEPITEGNFSTALEAAGEPLPAVAGAHEEHTVTGLAPDSLYYFALRVIDESANTSGLSNVAQGRTLPGGGADSTAPRAIADLATGAVTQTSVLLNWTAPGDDDSSGTAAQYDVRYSTTPIHAGNYEASQQANGEPAPAVAGSAQTMNVTGLLAGIPYYFAVKTADEVPNWSALSNVVEATTLPSSDVTPPAAVTSLTADALDSTSVQLEWLAPGDNGNTGTATLYDVRYSSTTITEESWAAATQAGGEPAPSVAGTPQSMVLHDFEPDSDYYFAIKTADEAMNFSSLSNVALAHTPAPTTRPPTPVAPQFPDSVCITSQDFWAQLAKSKTYSHNRLTVVYLQAVLGEAFFGPMAGGPWQSEGNCWSYSYQVLDCTYAYEVCRAGVEYSYTLTLNGSCEGVTHSDWVAFRCAVNPVTRNGVLYAYEEGTTDVRTSWIWSWTANGTSGSCDFYEGDPASTPVQATLEWTRSADGGVYDMTYIAPAQVKLVGHFVKEPCAGWLKIYRWSGISSDWWLEHHIGWNADRTGFWYRYDQGGGITEAHSW